MTPVVRVQRTLEALSRGTGPIVVGPWLTEVGYEVLYWIPFVAWAQETYGLDRSRLVVVSRGGCQSWYAHLADRYLDVLSWFTPAEFHRANKARVRLQASRRTTQKHLSVGDFDEQILARVRHAIGADTELLHPSLMYGLFATHRPWSAEWQGYSRYRPWRPVTPLEGLPARYVAVRFYTSSICPDQPDTRARMTERVCELLTQGDAVLVNPGVRCDEHHDYAYDGMPGRLHRIEDRLTPATNLDVQTRVIAGASKLVGTYGGFCYVAPFLGIDADTVYTDRAALVKLGRHLTVIRRVLASHPSYGALTVSSLAKREVYA